MSCFQPWVKSICLILVATAFSLGNVDANGLRFQAANQASYVIKQDGSLWAWGINTAGQLGLGDTRFRGAATQVGLDIEWRKISSREGHVLALKSDGSLWAWGNNASGQLGLGDTAMRLSPTRVGSDSDWFAIAAGKDLSIALKHDGSLWTWGSNVHGALGRAVSTYDALPTQVGSELDWSQLAVGSGYVLAIKTNGQLWTWGVEPGRLSNLSASPPIANPTPTRIGDRSDWISISAFEIAMAINRAGELFSWGAFKGSNRLGAGESTGGAFPLTFVSLPTRVGTLTTWRRAEIGGTHAIAETNDGQLWYWGSAICGALGYGAGGVGYSTYEPTRLAGPNVVATISLSDCHTLVLRADGTLYGWGDNQYGTARGDGTFGATYFPYTIMNAGAITLTGGDKVSREFYLVAREVYFRTADNAEADFVAGGGAGAWTETARRFRVGGSKRVCRFYGNTSVNPATGTVYGPASHFYTIDDDECYGLKAAWNPNQTSWKFESDDFFATPNVGQACPVGTLPVFRAYNNGFPSKDSNHRFDTRRSTIKALTTQGWADEGVKFCVPE